MNALASSTSDDWNLGAFDKSSTRHSDSASRASTIGSTATNVVGTDPQISRTLASIRAQAESSTFPRAPREADTTSGKSVAARQPALIEAEAVSDIALHQELAKIVRHVEPLEILERWYGVVEDVRGDEFSARLSSTSSAGDLPHEAGQFSVRRLSADDRQLLCVGAHFTYIVAREIRRGTPQTFSKITFRRMPMWHLRQIAASKAEGKRISQYLNQQTAVWNAEQKPTSFGR